MDDEELVAIQKPDVLIIRKIEDVNKGSEFFLSDEQIAQLIDASPSNRDKVIISLLARCGMRRDEVRCLNVDEIDFENRQLNLTHTKRFKRRSLPAKQDVLRDLSWLVAKRTTGYVFLSREGSCLNNSQINRIVAKAGERAGIKNPNPKLRHLNPHILRHSFARNFLRKGGRIEVLQKLLGHSSITTTVGIYGKPSMKDIRDEYERCVK